MGPWSYDVGEGVAYASRRWRQPFGRFSIGACPQSGVEGEGSEPNMNKPRKPKAPPRRNLCLRSAVEAQLARSPGAYFTHNWECWENPELRLNYCSPSRKQLAGPRSRSRGHISSVPPSPNRAKPERRLAVGLKYSSAQTEPTGFQSPKAESRRSGGNVQMRAQLTLPIHHREHA
jgi:hypothetical protein